MHDGHRRGNGEAHSTQNFALSGLSAPHFAQRMAVTRHPSLARRSTLNAFQRASQRLDTRFKNEEKDSLLQENRRDGTVGNRLFNPDRGLL